MGRGMDEMPRLCLSRLGPRLPHWSWRVYKLRSIVVIMELDEDRTEQQESAGITYQLHPRVLFRISDAYTRVKVGATTSTTGQDDGEPVAMEIEKAGPRSLVTSDPCDTAVGCLLGEQQGRTVEIVNSFDMPSMDFDWAMFQRKIDLFKEMYPNVDVVGWYVTMPKDAELGEEHFKLQKAFAETWCPSPVIMAYDPRPSTAPGQKATENALRLFESEEHNNHTVFRLAGHEMHQADVERIVVNQFRDLLDVSEDPTGNKSNAVMRNHQKYLKSAVDALIERATRLQQVLIGIKEGRLQFDEGVVTAIAAFVDRLPLDADGMSLARSGVPSEMLVEEQNDVLLKSLLAGTMAAMASLETHATFDASKVLAKEENRVAKHTQGQGRGQDHGRGHHFGAASLASLDRLA